jgi:hypothetical protein
MKKLLTLIITTTIIFINFIGCTTINQTLYLQNIQVSGPMNNPPLNITTNQKQGSFTISPRFSINDNKQLSGRIEHHSFVDNQGIYRVDTVLNNGTRYYTESNGKNINEYKGNNLIWNLPSFLAAVNIDYSAGDHIALNLGLNYAVQNQESYVGGNAGIGFFSEKESSAFRFDAGVMWQSLSYVASTVVVTEETSFWGTSSNTTVNFFKDRNKSTNWNPYVSLTFNTSSKAAPVNFFVNLGYFGQTLFSFEPSDPNPEYYPLGFSVITSDQRGESTTTFLNLSSGVFINMTETSKIILGVRLLKETQIEESSKSLFILPVIQFDMSL